MSNTWDLGIDQICKQSRDAVRELSEFIWEHPEENFEEVKSHDYLVEFFRKQGFSVEPSFLLPTGFKAEYTREKLDKYDRTVNVICEYDALPTIGHACGHNLIAACGALTALIVKHFIETDPAFKNHKLIVLGTPAEEGGGGKVTYIEAGFFKDVDISVMAHPSPSNVVFGVMFAIIDVKLRFFGKEAHAAGYPWKGVNALDAAVSCYSSISNMRHQFKPDWRVHGIFTNGGAKPNIIPATAELFYYIRTKDQEDMEPLTEKILNCARGAALASGCRFEHEFIMPMYKTVVTNRTLGNLCQKFMTDYGLPCVEGTPTLGSTDMGNVSHEVPSIHPCFEIGEEVNHTPGFTQQSKSEFGFEQTIKMSKALAATVLSYLSDPETQRATLESFKAK